MSRLASAAAEHGWATWNVEYRRLGRKGAGSWPASLQDVAAALDHLGTIEEIDIDRVAVVGHEAGGQLAAWLASRPRLPSGAPGSPSGASGSSSGPSGASAAPGASETLGASGAPSGSSSGPSGAPGASEKSGASGAQGRPATLQPRVVVCLAGLLDLAAAYEEGLGQGAVAEFVGGTPAEMPERYAQASPAALVPAACPVVLIHGDSDTVVPLSQSKRYLAAARAAGDRQSSLTVLEGTGHHELLDPDGEGWGQAVAALTGVLTPPRLAYRPRRS